MTAETLPAWATDPRGLPPAVIDNDGGDVWVHVGHVGHNFYRDTYGNDFDLQSMERDHGPCTPLWPETPAQPIDPDDIREGMRVGLDPKDGRDFRAEGKVVREAEDWIHVGGRAFQADRYNWFLLSDPDADLIAAVIDCHDRETARALIATIRGERA